MMEHGPVKGDLNRYVISITGDEAQHFGTGFAIHRDETGTYIVTCLHVVEQVGTRGALKAHHQPAQLLHHGFDLALLRVSAPLDIPLLPLVLLAEHEYQPGQPFQTAGFYLSVGERLLKPIVGTLAEQVTWESDTHARRVPAWYVATGAAGALQPGYSGAPVVDQQGRVIAVISQRQDEGRRGLAISLHGLQAIWPEMPQELWAGRPQHRRGRAPGAEPLMNFEQELALFESIAAGQETSTQLILIHGPSGMGKSHLLREYQTMARAGKLLDLWIDLGSQMTVDECFDELLYAFGIGHFPNMLTLQNSGRPEPFTPEKEKEWQRTLPRTFFADLSNYHAAPRLVLIFDQYEKADRSLRNWLNNILLPGLQRQPLVVVIAGQETLERSLPWAHHKFVLKGVAVDWYHRYVQEYALNMEPFFIKNQQ